MKKYSNLEVFEEVQSRHKRRSDFEEGDLEERVFTYASYSLEEVSLSLLDETGWDVDEELALEYSERETSFPPVVISINYDIIDGAHRVRAAKIKGLKFISAYLAQA